MRDDRPAARPDARSGRAERPLPPARPVVVAAALLLAALVTIVAVLVAPVASAAPSTRTPVASDSSTPSATASPPTATPTRSEPPATTASPEGTTAPSATPTVTGSSAGSVPVVPTRGATTPSASPTTSPTSSASATPAVAPRPRQRATEPAARRSGVGIGSVVIAVLVLLAAAGALWWYFRGRRVLVAVDADGEPVYAAPEESTTSVAPEVVRASGEVLWQFLIRLGEALVASGDAVNNIGSILQRVARAYGVDDAEIVVLPTALMLTVPGAGTAQTAVSATARTVLRLDQVDAVFAVQRQALDGSLDLRDGIEMLRRARTMRPRFDPVVTALGHALLTVGLVLILHGDLASLLLGAVLGGLVGAAKLWSATRPEVRTLLPITAALVVSATVLLIARTGVSVEVLPAIVAPLVTFLPGGALTTSVIELAAGDMIAGASRLVLGLMQLVLLALGIVGGAQLVGLPASDVLRHTDTTPLGVLAPWLGVLVFGVGVYLHYSSRAGSLPWMLLVLYVAYAGQILGGVLFGGALSGLVGAMVMTPVALFVGTQPSGPPAIVTFLPAFWLLVPGAIGLVGVTEVFASTRADGVATLAGTGLAIIGIALGVLLGLGLGRVLGVERDSDRRRPLVQGLRGLRPGPGAGGA